MDSLALEFHISGESKTFCYRSFSEILNLVIASLLRELLQYQQGIHFKFWKFDIKGLFINCLQIYLL